LVGLSFETVEATVAAKVQDAPATSFVTGGLKYFRRPTFDASWPTAMRPAKERYSVFFPSNLSASVRRNTGSTLPSNSTANYQTREISGECGL
jgi:hypothetical protein